MGTSVGANVRCQLRSEGNIGSRKPRLVSRRKKVAHTDGGSRATVHRQRYYLAGFFFACAFGQAERPQRYCPTGYRRYGHEQRCKRSGCRCLRQQMQSACSGHRCLPQQGGILWPNPDIGSKVPQPLQRQAKPVLHLPLGWQLGFSVPL